MNRRLPPNLYQRQYTTHSGYKKTLYYPRIRCWDGKRRTFPGVENFTDAKAELHRLMELNRQHYDFDCKHKSTQVEMLYSWIDKFLKVKDGKLSIARDRISARWLKAFFPDCPLTDIVNTRMLEYRNYRQVSDTTINRELAFLRGVLYLAHRDDKLLKMPQIPFEEENNERVRVMSNREYAAILKGLSNRPDVRDVVILLHETGFRVSEILKLTAADLDADTHSIYMKRIRSKGGFKRPLPMSTVAWKILARKIEKNYNKLENLFPGLTRYAVRDHFTRVCKQANIKGLWVHDIRGSFVTERERQGWPRKIIREYTGHRSELVFNRYSRPTDDDLRAFIRGSRQRIGNGRVAAEGKR